MLGWVRGISADSPEVALLKHAFPFAEFSVRPHSAYYTSLDLTTKSGQVSLAGELEALRASEGDTGYYYGVVANLGSIAGWGQLPGWVSMGVTRPTTLAHEVGHNLSLRHAPAAIPVASIRRSPTRTEASACGDSTSAMDPWCLPTAARTS